MKTPLLSVGVPVYNGQQYLPRALDSLLGQDFDDFELIISDNGSTDATASICQAYAERDGRIRYYRSELNHGATWNFRRVFELAQGKYFKWAAADDECYPTMLRRCLEVMEMSGDSVTLVYPRFEFIDESGSPVKLFVGAEWDRVHTSASKPYLRLAHVLFHSITGIAEYGVMNVSYLRQARPYGSIAADWVKLAEMAMLGRIAEVPEVLFRFRLHKDNSVIINNTWHQLLAWHDPGRVAQAPWMPYDCAIILEYLKSIHSLPLSPSDKMLCYLVACVTPPCKWSIRTLLRSSGSARGRLRRLTGWKWIARGGLAD